MPLVPRVNQDRQQRSGRCDDGARDTEHRPGQGEKREDGRGDCEMPHKTCGRDWNVAPSRCGP